MLLTELAHPMAIPHSMRRAAQAVSVTLSLMREASGSEHVARPCSGYVAVDLKEVSIWGTRCDAPLLLEEAKAAADASRRDILIVRLRATLEKRSPVTFDWVPRNRTRPHRCGLLPAMTFGTGLALVHDEDEQLRLNVSAGGIQVAPVETSWGLQRPLASARAIAVFKNALWQGL